jgi:1,4-alpha-glucan branching enzyme
VFSYERRGRDGRPLIVVANFTPVVRHDYWVGAAWGGGWREVLNTDAREYGGSGIGNGGRVEAVDSPSHGRPAALRLTLPPLGLLVLEPEG